MGQYHLELRAKLATFRAKLESTITLGSSEIYDFIQIIYNTYVRNPEKSPSAQYHLYLQLYEICKTHFPLDRVTKEMKEFLDTLDKKIQEAQTLYTDSWTFTPVCKITKRTNTVIVINDLDNIMSSSYQNIKGKAFIKLRQYSHRLMRDKKFPKNKYPLFHGSQTWLAAFKFKKDIARFQNKFSNSLSISQQSDLTDCIDIVDDFLIIDGQLIFNRVADNRMSHESDKRKLASDVRLNDLCFMLYHMLDQLKPGKRLVVPHGYNRKPGEDSHTALVEFERQHDGTFKISFINTNYNSLIPYTHLVSFHLQRFAKYIYSKNTHIPYIEKISLHSMIQEDLIIKILTPIFIELELNSINDQDKMHEAFNCYYDQMKFTDHSYSLQRNGTCTFSCWRAWLEWRLDSGLFHAFDLFVNQRALNKLDQYSQNSETPESLKQGVPELISAGDELVEKCKNDFGAWFINNNGHLDWENLSAIGNVMNVFPQLKIISVEEENKKITETSIADCKRKKPALSATGTGWMGMFTKAIIGTAIVTVVVETVYLGLM